MNRREVFREDLHPIYLPFYDALCIKMPDHWQPISGFRTFEQQQALYAQGRTIPGRVVTRSEPGHSFHNWGLATDWDYFLDGAYWPLTYEDSQWKEYIEICEEVGVKCLKWERPHNQLKTSITTKQLMDIRLLGGDTAVDEYLQRSVSDGSG